MLNRGNKLKEDSMEGIWDEKPEKLLGVVVSASLPGIKEEIYTCQVTKKLAAKKKTKEWEKFISKESSWPQFFFAVPDSSNLELTITDKSGKVAGTYEIKVDDLKQDTVVAGEYELQVSDKKKKKAGESDDPQGKVDVRVYYSLLMETRPPGPGPHTYNYADYLGQIKTGDLVVYSGTGVLAAACQLITNTPYSHIGLAVYLPNRWTQEPELYIVELTKNFNRFQDAFKEVAESGINIFRFKERVHQYHGNSPVWWVPLKEPLSPVHQQVLVEWIWKMHRGDQAVEDNIPPISVSKMTEFLTSRFKITVSYDVMLDFYSPAFVYKALGLAGALEEDMTKYSEGLFASDVVKLPCFGAPVQIRHKADDARVAGTQTSSLAAGFAAASANKEGGRAKSGSMDGLPPVTGEPAARPRLGTAIGTPTKLGGSATGASPPGSQILPNPAAAAAAGGVAAPRRPQPAVPPRGAPPSIVHTATAGGMAGGVAAAAASVARNRPPSQTISSPLSAITQSHSPSNSSTGVTTKPGLGSAKTSLAAPPPLVAPSALPMFAAAPVPAPLESREKRREKMMTLSRKFGTSRLAVTSLGIEGDFNSDEKAENAIDAIVAKMRGPGGIPMADINWQGKNYTKCFLGCDAVDWMLKCKVATTRDQAVELANEILVTGRLYHLSRRMAFIDGMEIYRFEARSPFRTHDTTHTTHIDDVEKTTSDKIPNVFQSSLENIMRRQRMATPDARVPKVMEVLIGAMMNLRATETEGIFRVPTSLTELEMLRKQFNSGDYACAAMRDAHLPACLLKLWLRDLSEALIPDYYYTNALYCDTLEDRQRLLKSLPEENQNVIVRLFELVYTLSKHSAVTKMDLNNLAMVFSPCFLRCPATDPLVVMENLPREGMFVRGSFGDYCKARDALAASTAAAAAGEQENKEAADQEASSKVEA